MGRKDDPLGTWNNPLTEDEIERFETAAEQSDKELTILTGRTLLNTGLRLGEFCHMRASWLQSASTNDLKILDVPFAEECIGGVDTSNNEDTKHSQSSDHRVPCHMCRSGRGDEWSPKSEAARRRIPISSDIYELLEGWFADHEQIPILHNGATRRVKRIAEQTGIEREVTPQDLRETFKAKLVRERLAPAAIQSLMGHHNSLPRPEPNDQSEFLSKWDDDDSESGDGRESSEGADGE